MSAEDTKDDEAPPPPEKKKSKKGLIIVVAVVLLAVGGGGYYFLGASKSSTAAASTNTTTTTEAPGSVVQMAAINVNLAQGRFLRIGVALELGDSADPKAFTDTSLPKINDLVIDVFQGDQMEVLQTAAGRDAAKAELKKRAAALFGTDYRDLYFTDFVMQ